MLFNSANFLIFFPIVVFIYYLIPKRARYIWLLVSSYYFYMCWNVKYVFLLLFSTLVTWLGASILSRVTQKKERNAVLTATLAANLALLFVFKYLDFFLQNIARVLGGFHITFYENRLDILLPVGISFYIFQSLSYTIDVYRNRITPEKNILRYALYVSFFPQLVAGPIERSESLLSQLRELDKKNLFSFQETVQGLILMVWGLFVKMVIADRVAILVKYVFDYYYQLGSLALFAGAIGFGIQIYCDFMGYSTIAVGAAKVMGIRLMDNFNAPYLAISISDFWKRWHISLSTWFRDYVYIPLGGNRRGKLRKYINLLITMTISGLWHGAAWNFLFWGFLHGVYQIVGEMTGPFRKKLYCVTGTKTESFSFRLAQRISTFLLVDFAWIFFRAGSISIAFGYIKRMFTRWDPWSLFNGELYTLGLDRFEFQILLVCLVILLLADYYQNRHRKSIAVFLQEQNIWFRYLVIIGLIGACLVYGVYGIQFDSTQFIYFQF